MHSIKSGDGYVQIANQMAMRVVLMSFMVDHHGDIVDMVSYVRVDGSGTANTDSVENFLKRHVRCEKFDQKKVDAYKLRCRATGLFKKANGADSPHGKAWATLGHLRLHVHSKIPLSDYDLKRNGVNELGKYAQLIGKLVREYECLNGDEVIHPEKWLSEDHFAIYSGNWRKWGY